MGAVARLHRAQDRHVGNLIDADDAAGDHRPSAHHPITLTGKKRLRAKKLTVEECRMFAVMPRGAGSHPQPLASRCHYAACPGTHWQDEVKPIAGDGKTLQPHRVSPGQPLEQFGILFSTRCRPRRPAPA